MSRAGTRANPATSHDNAGIAAWRFKMVEEVRSFDQAREVFERLYMETTPANATTERVKLWPASYETSRYGYRIGPQMYLFDSYADEHDQDCYSIVLYETEIARFYADGTFSVGCGDWTTPTTRERLQAVVPDGFRVYFHRRQLGLLSPAPASRWATRAKPENQPPGVLWPLDHDDRIDPTTGEKVS